MKKLIINVPKDIEFISDWKDFNLPDYPHILNKQLTGCGFTQWALTCPMNLILCSPRRILLENKYKQFLKDQSMANFSLPYNTYYARNNFEKVTGIDKDLTRASKSLIIEDKIPVEKAKDYYKAFKKNLQGFCLTNTAIPKKILVTYDSFRKVKEALEEIGVFDQYYIVVDEMQSVFVDAKFKSDTENEFINVLSDINKLCYVSATPMIERYLDMLPEFKDLPYFELDWGVEDPNRIMSPKITSTPCSKIVDKALNIIDRYRTETWRDSDNCRVSYYDSAGQIREIQSKEAVLYINSVKNICDIIRRGNLKQDECNILCANTPENVNKVRKAFGLNKKDFNGLGEVPLKGEPHKMFTFCTRTVYLGADFQSTCAKSYVFSDANIDSLAVDITLDLPQILGRQRNEENPWKNELTIYYIPIRGSNKVPKDVFDAYILEKKEKTETLLSIYDKSEIKEKCTMAEFLEMIAKSDNYKNNFIAVNRHAGGQLIPQFNNTAMIAEMRAFDVQQVDYANRCTIRRSINDRFNLTDSEEITSLLSTYESYTNFIDKMRFICELVKSDMEEDLIKLFFTKVEDYIINYIDILGIARIEALSYRRDWLEKEYKRVLNNQFIDPTEEIYSEFVEGGRYSNKYLKQKLDEIYSALGYKKTPKATDINEYFETKVVQIILDTGKKVNGLELIKKK